MEHKIWYDSKNEVVCAKYIGRVFAEDVSQLSDEYVKNIKDKPYNQLLMDLTDVDTAGLTNELRKANYDVVFDAGFKDVAIYGTAAATRMLVKVIIKLGTIGKRTMNIDFFKSAEDGIAWLMEERKKDAE